MAKKIELPVVVNFDMWGQRCCTVFDKDSEMEPLMWLQRMYDKGWLMPVSLLARDGESMSEMDLLEIVDKELYNTRRQHERQERL